MYGGFTVKHFHEHLQARHGYRLGYTVTRLTLQAAGLVKRAARRGRTGASGRAGHGRACCCTRTPHAISGSRAGRRST